MPTTPILDSTNARRMFAYDEMVMSSDGTRYYIKYLDGAPPKRTTLQQQQPQSARPTMSGTTVLTRPSTASSQLLTQKNSTNLSGNEAKRPRMEATPLVQNRTITPQTFTCGICQQKFNNRASLNFHIERMHKDSDGPVDCPCGKRFANKKYMKRHQKRRFETDKIICGREPHNGFQFTYKNL